MERVESDRGYLYVQEGFVYKINKIQNGNEYFKCVEVNCSGRAVLREGEALQRAINHHNHPPDDVALELLQFKLELKRRASSERIRPRELFNAVSRQYPRACTRLGFPSVRSLIYRYRRKGMPPIPHSLPELGHILQQDAWAHLAHVKGEPEQETFFRGLIGSEGEGWWAAVYLSSRITRNLENTRLHIDGTFKTVPQDLQAYQLLTVHSDYLNQLFPVAFVVMSRKTQVAYEGVFRYLQQLVPELQPEVILTDFELACRNAAHSVWPSARLVGCFFHFAQAVYRMHMQLRLHDIVMTNAEGKKALHMLMALALLPAESMAQGLLIVRNYVYQHDLFNSFRIMLGYMQNFWMNTIGPTHFSVYRETHRTNNAVEGFHSRLIREIGPHPSVWNFHEKLRDIEVDQFNDVTRMRANIPIVRPRSRAQMLNDRAINEATDKLSRGFYNVAQFLSRMAYVTYSRLAQTGRVAAEPVMVQQDSHEEETMSLQLYEQRPERTRPERRRRQGRPHRQPQQRPRVTAVEPQSASSNPIQVQQSGTSGNIQQPPIGQDIVEQAAPYWSHYRTIPIQHREQPYMTEADVARQRDELLQGLQLGPNEEPVCEADEDQPTCCICLVNTPTRMAIPCGHNVVCRECLPRFVQQTIYERYTGLGGVVETSTIRLPITCPNCRAIIGQVIPTYI